MIRKLLVGGAALALPLAGGAVFGGAQLANGAAPATVPHTLACTINGSVTYEAGSTSSNTSYANPAPGDAEPLWLNAEGAATDHDGNSPSGDAAGQAVIYLNGSDPVPGQSVKIGSHTYIAGSTSNTPPFGTPPWEVTLTTNLVANVPFNTAVDLLATTGANNTTPYYATNENPVSLDGTACGTGQYISVAGAPPTLATADGEDFSPVTDVFTGDTPVTSTGAPSPTGGNSALGLQAASSLGGTVSYSGADADYSANNAPELLFGASTDGCFNGGGYSYGFDATEADGSGSCITGHVYSSGHFADPDTGAYGDPYESTANVAGSTSLAGAIACTYGEVATLTSGFTVDLGTGSGPHGIERCDGGTAAPAGYTGGAQGLTELATLEITGMCAAGCSSDGTPVIGIAQIDLTGTSNF